MHKDYIKEQYKLATADYQLARSDAERSEALRSLHRLTNLAAEAYGFDFADSLQQVLPS